MNQHRCSTILLLALVACATPAAAIDQVSRFDGVATDIGVQREPGGTGGVEFRIRGEFDYAGEIDFSSAAVIWLSLLEEVGDGAAGELITTVDEAPVVPLTILARASSTHDTAVFETHRYRPQTRLQLRQKNGHFEFRLKLDRGLSRKVPALCTGDPPGQKSLFRHHFVLDDGVHPAIEVIHLQQWDCSNLEGFQLKAKTPNTPGGGTDGTPRPTPLPTPVPPPNDGSVHASLRVDALTRNTDQPDLIALDGSGSTDTNGAIVRYVFDSGDGRVQDGPASRAEFVYAPGSYLARLTVYDATGNGAVATRTFSDK
jgi:hypothetical protein